MKYGNHSFKKKNVMLLPTSLSLLACVTHHQDVWNASEEQIRHKLRFYFHPLAPNPNQLGCVLVLDEQHFFWLDLTETFVAALGILRSLFMVQGRGTFVVVQRTFTLKYCCKSVQTLLVFNQKWYKCLVLFPRQNPKNFYWCLKCREKAIIKGEI